MLSQRRIGHTMLSAMVGICALVGAACSTDQEGARPAAGCIVAPGVFPGGDGPVTAPSGPQDAAASARNACGGADGPPALEAAPALPDASQAADQAAAELGQVLDAGVDQVDQAQPCPPGYYLAGGGPADGGGMMCPPPGAPTFPCTRPRDGWCPNYCPVTTICSPAGWVCCSKP